MKSKVLNKIVFVTDENEICMCDTEFRKTCVVRIANNYPCCETMVRLTPVERVTPSETCDGVLGEESEISKAVSEFEKTLRHFDRMR